MNILQQVKLTVKPSDRKGFLMTYNGVRNNGVCSVSCYSNMVIV